MSLLNRTAVDMHDPCDVPEVIAAAQVEAELARSSLLRLPFSPALEAHFESEAKAARAWTIRLTLTIGLVAYNVFTLTDIAVLPDLLWAPAVWRLFVITPIALLAMWKCTEVQATHREAFLTFMMLGAMIGPVTFILTSRAPLAPYTMLIVILVSMFGNITIRLRFHWAGIFTFLSLFWVACMLWLKPDLPLVLSVHLFLALVVCVSFGLVANNQLERAERRSFLLTLREALRSEQLIVEKADLSVLSQIDALTGLANRRAFDQKLEVLWQKSPSQPFCLLMVDVDFFKLFNDHYGHIGGDECLARVGRILRDAVVRVEDQVSRYGGEEFAILLENCTAQEAVGIAERIRVAILSAAIIHRNRDDGDSTVSVSIGVAASATDGAESSRALIVIADRNLYQAKRAGRNQVFPWLAAVNGGYLRAVSA